MRFHEMTAPEIQQVDREDTVVIAPIAACEQHGPHLATYTDTVLVTGVAEGVEEQTKESVLLLPTFWLGASQHHLPWGGTLTLEVDTHVYVLCELLAPILDEGFKRILVLNGHGGNIDTFQVALRKLQPQYPDRILTGASYWDLAAKDLAELAAGPRKQMGHACEFETSMMLALRPDLVRTELIQDDPNWHIPESLSGLFIATDFKQRTDHGVVGHPEQYSAERGQAFLNAAINRTVEVVHGILERALPESE